ncbi:MAG: helix-turn-helix domain-containing protein [Acidobacteriaceae bacterium]
MTEAREAERRGKVERITARIERMEQQYETLLHNDDELEEGEPYSVLGNMDRVGGMELQARDKAVLLWITRHAQPNGRGAFLSLATLSALSGYARSTVELSLSWLKNQGLISWKKGDPAIHRSNEYTVHLNKLTVSPKLERIESAANSLHARWNALWSKEGLDGPPSRRL